MLSGMGLASADVFRMVRMSHSHVVLLLVVKTCVYVHVGLPFNHFAIIEDSLPFVSEKVVLSVLQWFIDLILDLVLKILIVSYGEFCCFHKWLITVYTSLDLHRPLVIRFTLETIFT